MGPAIDCHAHVFTATASAVPGARYRPTYEATLAQWQRQWRAVGVTHGVLVQPSFFGTDNSEMLAALRKDPRHLRGVAVVEAGVEEKTLQALQDAGVRAIRFNLRGAAPDRLDLPGWGPTLQGIAARGWHLEVFADAGAVPRIARALASSPMRIVFDHFGHPDPRDVEATFSALEALRASHEIWAKLSAPYRLNGADPKRLVERWIDLVGTTRLVWGSDWPWTGHQSGRDYADLLANVGRWVGKPGARAVLWDNPARLYGF